MMIDVQNEEEHVNNGRQYNIKSVDEKVEELNLGQSMRRQHDYGFMIEILICSIILWIFLFLLANNDYKDIIFKIDEMLSEKTRISFIIEYEEQVLAFWSRLFL